MESLGGEDAALAALGVSRDDFFDTFGNDLSASESDWRARSSLG